MERVALLCLCAALSCGRETPEPPPARVSDAEFDAAATQVCRRLLECGGQPNPPPAELESCLEKSRRLAIDDLRRAIVHRGNLALVAACQGKPCGEYQPCYEKTLQLE